MSTAPSANTPSLSTFEEGAEIKHEFFRGEIFAMSGGTHAYAMIIGNLYFRLRSLLSGMGCHVASSEQRIYVKGADLDTYPDVSVVCGKIEMGAEDPEAITNPVVLFQVLSPSREKYDRTTKFSFYRQLRSLRQYVLVSQEEPLVETFTKGENGKWEYADAAGLDAKIELSAIQAQLSLMEIYEGVEFAAGPHLPRQND